MKPLTSSQSEKKEGRSVLEKLKSTIHPGRSSAHQVAAEAERSQVHVGEKRKISTGICVYFHIQYSFVLLFDTNINLLWISSRTPPTDEHVQLLPISSLLDWTYYFQHQGEKCWSHYCSDSDFTAYSEPNKNDVQPWLLKNTSHSYHFANDLII